MYVDIEPTSLLDPQVIDRPYEFYRQLRDQAPVWEIPDTGIFTVSTFELLAEAASRVEDFSSNVSCLLFRSEAGLPCRLPLGDFGGQALATADPPVHALHRSTVFPELVAKRMALLEPEIEAVADSCITEALAAGATDFMTTVGNVIPITMISRLIGFRDSDVAQLLAAAFDSTAMLSSTLSHDELVTLLGRSGEIQEWVARQLSTALRDPQDDLLGAVARGVDGGVFNEFEAVITLHTLLSAGGESTTSLLGNAVRLLAEHQDLQDDLRQDPDGIVGFIEEALRLEPPFRYHLRTASHDTTIGGVDVPEGATVLLLWGAANRDQHMFEHPDEIDLDRKVPRRHVAFGRGIHHCVGAPLARVEARAVLSTLLARTSRITLDTDHSPTWTNSLMVRRLDELPIRLIAS